MTQVRAEELVAVVDVGTNSALLLVARGGGPDEPLVEVEGLARTPRLGAGLASDGRAKPSSVARLVEVLLEYRGRCDELGVAPDQRRVVGTAIFRRASNAAEVLAEVAEKTGFSIEVLSEDDEARLGYEAVTAGGAAAGAGTVDVGGGSTEVVLDGGDYRCSVPVGAVVLTERWLGLDGAAAARSSPAGTTPWKALLADAAEALAEFPEGGAGGATLVALGGTGANLACLELGLESFDHRRAEGVCATPESAAAWAERLASLSLAERTALPIESERAEILPAGLACLALAAQRLDASELRVTHRGLRFAVASALLAAR